MIQKVKAFIAKDVMTVEQMAEKLNLPSYNAIHRGGYTVVFGTDAQGDRISLVCGPYVLQQNMTGARRLLDAGFSDIDMCLALGLSRRAYTDLKKKEREEKKAAETAAKQQTPRRGSTISLDDL